MLNYIISKKTKITKEFKKNSREHIKMVKNILESVIIELYEKTHVEDYEKILDCCLKNNYKLISLNEKALKMKKDDKEIIINWGNGEIQKCVFTSENLKFSCDFQYEQMVVGFFVKRILKLL